MVDTNQVLNIIVSGNLNKVVAAIVVLLIAFLIARFFGNLIEKILKELNVNKLLKENFDIKLPVENLVNKIIYYVILLIGVITALKYLGLSIIILYLILMIIILIIVVLILLALKDFVPNVFSSFWIHQKKIVDVGDEIEVREITGKVIEINLTDTKIETEDKEIIFMPNSLMLKEKIKKKK